MPPFSFHIAFQECLRLAVHTLKRSSLTRQRIRKLRRKTMHTPVGTLLHHFRVKAYDLSCASLSQSTLVTHTFPHSLRIFEFPSIWVNTCLESSPIVPQFQVS